MEKLICNKDRIEILYRKVFQVILGFLLHWIKMSFFVCLFVFLKKELHVLTFSALGSHHTFPSISLSCRRINISSTVDADYYTCVLFVSGNKDKCDIASLDALHFPQKSIMNGNIGAAFIYLNQISVQFSSVQSLSHVWLFVTPWIAARQASLSITNSRSSPKLMSVESVMPSSHLILCRRLLLPPIPPSIRVFSSESTLHEVAKVLDFQL